MNINDYLNQTIIILIQLSLSLQLNYDYGMILRRIGRSFCSSASVSKKQMELFNRLTGWWHPSGPSQILYLYNYKRIQFLRKFLQPQDHRFPLKGKQVLDVGCGAGFLSESLARLGGNVIGLDPNSTSFSQATSHKSTKSDLKSLNYHNKSLQQYIADPQLQPKKFDIVTSMQVIQHVNQPQQFLNQLSSVTKQGGLIMLSTIRRSTYSLMTHIVLAQKILGIVPEGTHHHEQFINPDQCSRMMSNSGYEPLEMLELELNWKGQFQQKSGGSNYLIIGRKKIDKKIP